MNQEKKDKLWLEYQYNMSFRAGVRHGLQNFMNMKPGRYTQPDYSIGFSIGDFDRKKALLKKLILKDPL